MVEGFAPHVGGKKPLSDFGMTESRTALLLLALGLQGSREGQRQNDRSRACTLSSEGTHDGIPLQRRGTSVEHKDRLDPVEEEFTDSAKEAQYVCVDQGPALLVTHRGLELVDPDAGVDGERFSLHGLQPFQVLSMSPN